MIFKQKQNGGAGASGNGEDCEQYLFSNPVRSQLLCTSR